VRPATNIIVIIYLANVEKYISRKH